MSDERMEELGLPRREFLKRAAVGAFVAPVVVSFAVDGIAEGARNQSKPNQTLPNQAKPNQAPPVERPPK